MAEHPNLPVNTRADGFEVDARVARILGLITRGEFIPGVSNRELQLEWGVQSHVVSALVTQAFRYIRLHRLGLEDDINRRLACIEEDRRLAQAKVRYFPHTRKRTTDDGKQVVEYVIDERPEPDVGAMLAADRLYLETIGALVRVKQLQTDDGETDIRVIIQAELRGNPSLVRQMLGMLPPAELKQLIEAQAEEARRAE